MVLLFYTCVSIFSLSIHYQTIILYLQNELLPFVVYLLTCLDLDPWHDFYFFYFVCYIALVTQETFFFTYTGTKKHSWNRTAATHGFLLFFSHQIRKRLQKLKSDIWATLRHGLRSDKATPDKIFELVNAFRFCSRIPVVLLRGEQQQWTHNFYVFETNSGHIIVLTFEFAIPMWVKQRTHFIHNLDAQSVIWLQCRRFRHAHPT